MRLCDVDELFELFGFSVSGLALLRGVARFCCVGKSGSGGQRQEPIPLSPPFSKGEAEAIAFAGDVGSSKKDKESADNDGLPA